MFFSQIIKILIVTEMQTLLSKKKKNGQNIFYLVEQM